MQVQVEEQVRLELVECLETVGVARVVEVRHQLSHLGHQLEEGAEVGVVDHLGLELRSVEGRQCAQRAVDRHVLRREDLLERAAQLGAALEELAGRQLVLFGLEMPQAGGGAELAHQYRVGATRVSRLRLRDVVGDVREVAHVDRDPDDVEAHRDDVLRRRAIVARAHVALKGHRKVSARRVEVAEVVVPHPDALFDQARLVLAKVVFKLLQPLARTLVLGLHPRVISHRV
mmetsp:Transcript_22307/g.45574  ORF Transcript_22307/g.45574 Transcript_22307/m.45574 type:complete len:231 (-) Transcript_22307:53-745(-)